MCFRSSANQIFSHAPLAPTFLSFIISPLLFRETDAYRTPVKQKSARSLIACYQRDARASPSVWKIRHRPV